MAENLVDIPVETVLDWILDTPSNNTVYNNVDLKCVNKVEIVYTRSIRDYIRSFIFSCLHILLIWFVLYVLSVNCINYFNSISKKSINNINYSTPYFSFPSIGSVWLDLSWLF